jgi:peptidoglycan hydrolase CwlO-like protein
MKTKQNKNLLAVTAVLIVCLIAVCFSTSIQGRERSYEIKPKITLPEYKTDTARVIDAYERMMDRFINLTERNLTGIDREVQGIARTLDSIDCKLRELSARTARIEKALGIEQPKKPVKKDIEAKTQGHTNKRPSGIRN